MGGSDEGIPEEPRDNPAKRRYEMTVDGQTAILRYARKPGVITLIHTEVPPSLRGRGVAGRLATFALESARAGGVRVVALCPYVRSYIERHPEYASLLAPRRGGGPR